MIRSIDLIKFAGGFVVMMGVLLWLSNVATAAVTLTNADISLTVNGGEADNGLVPSDGYFRYTDLTAGEETTWSIDPVLIFDDGSTAVLSNGMTGGFGTPTDLGTGVVRSTATVSGIDVEAETELIGLDAKTTFTFTRTEPSAGSLDTATFVFYAENDLFSAANDLASFEGSITGDDLALFMFDSVARGLTVRITGEAVTNATLDKFGAGVWTAWGTAIESGDLSGLSADGSNFVTSGDLGLALAYSLTGDTASVVIHYQTQPQPPDVPEPTVGLLLGVGMLGMICRRRVA